MQWCLHPEGEYYSKETDLTNECEEWRYCYERGDIKRSEPKSCHVWYVFGSAVIKAQIIALTLINLSFIGLVVLLSRKGRLTFKKDFKTVLSLVGTYIMSAIFTLLAVGLLYLIYIVWLNYNLYLLPAVILVAMMVVLIFVKRRK